MKFEGLVPGWSGRTSISDKMKCNEVGVILSIRTTRAVAGPIT